MSQPILELEPATAISNIRNFKSPAPRAASDMCTVAKPSVFHSVTALILV